MGPPIQAPCMRARGRLIGTILWEGLGGGNLVGVNWYI